MPYANSWEMPQTPADWSEMIQDYCHDAVLQERQRFSNELHDVVANHLSAATLLLAKAQESLPAGEVKNLIDQAKRSVFQCWKDARNSAKDLRQADLMDRDLPAALAEYAEKLSAASGVSISFKMLGDALPMTEVKQFTLLRIAQQAVTNALRHGHPTHISIELVFSPDGVGLKVSDNGYGFDTAQTSEGLGIAIMRNRARQIGAELVVLSHPAHGTELTLTVPAGRADGCSPSALSFSR